MERFKGEWAPYVLMRGGDGGSGYCEDTFSHGEQYLVYAYKGGVMGTNLCAGNTPHRMALTQIDTLRSLQARIPR